MKMLTVFLVCLLPGLFSLSSAAQSVSPSEDPVTVLVRTALESNPGLKAQRRKIAAALERPGEAGALPDPTADVEFMMLPVNHLNARDAVTKGVSVGITQELPYPGKRKLREDKARREAEAADADLQTMESDLAGKVKVAAYRYALYIRLLELNSQKAGSLRAAEQGAMGLYSSGGGTQTDLLSAQTAITQNEKERLDLEQERDITAARLDDLLGGQADRALLGNVALTEVSRPPQLDSMLAESKRRAPRVIAAQAGEKVEEQQADIARSDFKPDFTVGGRYRHNDVTMGGGNYFTIMAGMTLPFFHRKDHYQPALEEALAQREGARQETSNVINQVRYELTEAWQNASHDRAVFDLLQNGLLIQAKQAYGSSLDSYSAGRTDFATLLKALADLYDYQGEALTAQADFLMARSRMEAILGLSSLEPATAPNPTIEVGRCPQNPMCPSLSQNSSGVWSVESGEKETTLPPLPSPLPPPIMARDWGAIEPEALMAAKGGGPSVWLGQRRGREWPSQMGNESPFFRYGTTVTGGTTFHRGIGTDGGTTPTDSSSNNQKENLR